MTNVIAHRGASAYAPENTLPAFEKAIKMGTEGIELDVHLSKDRELVVIHDEKVDRTSNGSGYVKDLTLSELKQLDFGSWFDEDFRGIKIPILQEIIDLIDREDWKGLLNIEIKNNCFLYPGIEEKLIEIVKENKLEETVLFSSFNHYSLSKIKKLEPRIKIGILYMANLVKPWLYAERLSADDIHPLFYNIINNPGMIEVCKEQDINVNVFTVNDKEVMKEIFKYGVNGIITNKPDLALEVRETL